MNSIIRAMLRGNINKIMIQQESTRMILVSRTARIIGLKDQLKREWARVRTDQASIKNDQMNIDSINELINQKEGTDASNTAQ